MKLIFLILGKQYPFAIAGSINGANMVFQGQELGISDVYGYDHYETNFGKQIPHFKRWNSMQPIWQDADLEIINYVMLIRYP